MEYIYKQYTIETKKVTDDKRIVTISDLHFNSKTDLNEIDALLLKINDLIPNYIFILGDIFTYNNLENITFQKNILLFFKLLSTIGKSYLIFGNHDQIEIQKKQKYFVNINKLLDFYQNTGIKVINNDLIKVDEFDIIGFNKFLNNYADEFIQSENLKREIIELHAKLKNLLTKDRFTIMLTHSHLDLLKTECQLLKYCDLILAGHTHNGLVPNFLESFISPNKGLFTKGKLFQNNIRGTFIENDQTFIVNGGITKISDNKPKLIKKITKSWYPSEIDLIKINTKK